MSAAGILLANPDPSGLPAPLWLLTALLVFTFVVHVLFMNVVLGSGFVWTWANWRAHRRGPTEAERAACRTLAGALGRTLPVATAFAITAGVAPLLFTQLLYGQVFYASSVLMACFWLAIVPLLLAGYYANYGIAFLRPAPARALALGALASALFFTIGFIFTNNMTLMLRPETFGPLYFASDAGLHANAGETSTWTRFLHMLVGSFAVTGLFVAWLGHRRRAIDAVTSAWMQQRGRRLFVSATLVQLVVGVALLVSLPVSVKDVLRSGATPDPILIGAGILFALAGVVIARRSLLVASGALTIAIVDMAIVRHRVRDLMLEPYFRTDSLAVAPQLAVFLLFAVLLVGGLAAVAWMVMRFMTAKPAETPQHAVRV